MMPTKPTKAIYKAGEKLTNIVTYPSPNGIKPPTIPYITLYDNDNPVRRTLVGNSCTKMAGTIPTIPAQNPNRAYIIKI